MTATARRSATPGAGWFFPRGGWVQLLRPSIVARGSAAVSGVAFWCIALAIASASGASGHPRVGTALFLAGMHLLAGMLLRGARVQGLWLGPGGQLALATVLGVTLIPKDAVSSIMVGSPPGSVVVTTPAARYWLELASRLGIGGPSRSAAAEAIAALRDAGYENVTSNGVLAPSGPPIKALEVSFRGFLAVVTHGAVVASVALGQFLFWLLS